MELTFNQIHVILDAIWQHADRIDGGTYDPTGIYDGPNGGVFPPEHPLRNLAEYRKMTDAVIETFTDALGTAGEESKITIAIEG